MRRATSFLTLLVILATGTLPLNAYATNGVFLIGFGSKSRSMGGTAIANPQDTLSGAANPAAIGAFKNRIDVSADLFLPSAESCMLDYTATFLCYESRANTFLIPAMGGAMKFNRKVSFGFSAVGVGGGGSRYNTNLYNSTNTPPNDADRTLGVNMMIMQMNPTVAYRINKQHTVGFSPVISVATFRAFGLDQFSTFTSDGLPLIPQGNDWSYGAGVRFGWLGTFYKKRLMLGATAQSRIYMTEFEKYDNLFAEQGDFDTPPNVGLGLSFKATDKITLAFDVTHTFYEDVASISNTGPNLPGDPSGPFPVSKAVNALGEDEGLGFGWENQTVYKVGIAYDYNDAWTFRAGWNYGKTPIDESKQILFNIVAPATVQHHLTLGTSYRPSKRVEWSGHYVHAFNFEQEGPTFIGSRGRIGMSQNSLGGSFSYYF